MSHLDPEKKVFDISIVNQNVTLAGIFLHVNDIPQNVSDTGRIGRQALMLSSQFTYNLALGAGATAPTFIKMWLMWTAQPSGAPPAFADFLNNPTVPTTSQRNLNNLGQYKVLWSRTLIVDIFSPAKKGFIMKRMRKKTRWVGVAGGIAGLDTGSLYLILASDAGALFPQINFTHRLRFTG